MSQAFHIVPVTALHPDIDNINIEAMAEGFRFVDKLIEEWASGTNRFGRSGEMFIAAFQGDRILGFCGVNRDPYEDKDEVARLRHLYVRQSARRSGIGSALLQVIIVAADRNFSTIRLRTDRSEAAAFYERHGFDIIENATATHSKALRSSMHNP